MKEKKHILVTGGAGFIGSALGRKLIADGYRVTVIDNLSTGELSNVPVGADFIKLDLGKEQSYRRLRRFACNAVMHLAGQSSGELSFQDPLYDLRSHVMSTFYLLRWCKETSVRRFMYASSMATYGDPMYLPVDEAHPLQPKTFYAAAKISAEAYIRFYSTLDLNTTIFRLFSVYGPGQNLANKAQGMVSIYLSYLLEGKPILVKGSVNRFRDLVYIDDVVDVWTMALNNPVSYGKAYNLASGRKTTVGLILDGIRKAAGKPNYPVKFKSGTPGDQFGMLGDSKLAWRELKWKAVTSLNKGLQRMVEYEMRHCAIGKKA